MKMGAGDSTLEVLDFQLPETGAKLHKFVGLCNYFRKHVGDIAKLESPLRGLIALYAGTRKIQWTKHPEAKEAFYKLQECHVRVLTRIITSLSQVF